MNNKLYKDEEILKIYNIVKSKHDKKLKSLGVKMPRLYRGDQYTTVGLMLVYLAFNYPNTKIVKKEELEKYLIKFIGRQVDVQQARDLATQNGFFIVSGGRNDSVEISLKRGEYKLVSLEKSYPGFVNDRRIFELDSFKEIK